jgi:hypothetical protein
MPYITADRVKESSTIIGTGTIPLLGAAVGFRTFASQMNVGDTCSYVISNTTGSEWEAGIATYSSNNTLTRNTVQSSTNANGLVNFSAGMKDVFIGPTSGSFPQYNPITNTITSGTWGGNSLTPSQVTGTAVITTDSRLSDSRPPTGVAGGVLAGTYPDPSFASTTGSGSVVLSTTPTLVTPQTNSISAVPVVSGAGNSLTLAAGSGVGTGAGGNLILQAGIQATTGGDGKVIIRGATGQTSNFLEIQNSSGTALVTASSNANITIGTTTTNQRLIIQSGTNAQNSEPAFVVKNAAGANVFFVDAKRSEVAIGSALFFGQGGATTAYFATNSQGNFSWVSGVTTAPDTDSVFAVVTSGNIIKSGGTTSYIGGIVSSCKFFPTSGTSSYASFVAASTINQTSTASGIVRGLYVNDTLTSVLGTYRAIETTYGNALINTGNPAYKGLLIQAAASQTANLQEWQNSSGTAVAFADSSGNIGARSFFLNTNGDIRGPYGFGDGNPTVVLAATNPAFLQLGSNGYIGWTSSANNANLAADTSVYKDAVGVLAQRNGTNPQAFRIYNTYTDASNYERLGITWASSICTIGLAQAGTGLVRSLVIAGANATSGAGGNVTITAGNGSGVGAGGNIILQPGAQGSSGGNGVVRFYSSAGVATGYWDPNTSTLNGGDALYINSKLRVRSGAYINGSYGLFDFATSNTASTVIVTLHDSNGFRMNRTGIYGFSNDVYGTNWTSAATDAGIGRADFGVTCVVRDTSKNGGSLSFPSTTTALSANTNDLALTASAFQRINCTSAASLTGIAPPSGGAHVDGRMVRVYNVGTANLTLNHNSALSTTGNKFFNSTGADIILAPNDYAELIYDSTNNGSGNAGWRVA